MVLKVTKLSEEAPKWSKGVWMESKVFSFHSNKLGFVYDPVFQGELFSFSFFKSGIKQTFHIPTSCFKAEFPALRRSSHLLVQSVVCRASQVGLVVKNPPANAGDRHRFDPWVGKIPVEEGTATYPSTLAWRLPQTEEPGSLQSIGSVRVRHHWSDLAHKQDGHYAIYLPYTISFIQYHCAFPTDRKLKPKAWNVHS